MLTAEMSARSGNQALWACVRDRAGLAAGQWQSPAVRTELCECGGPLRRAGQRTCCLYVRWLDAYLYRSPSRATVLTCCRDGVLMMRMHNW